MKKWFLVAAVFPYAAGVFVLAKAWERWHFGGSQRILRFAKAERKRLLDWRVSMETHNVEVSGPEPLLAKLRSTDGLGGWTSDNSRHEFERIVMDTLENAQKRAEYWKAEHMAANAENEELLDLLATIFDAYEEGPDCYEDPEDCSGHLGKAVKLDDAAFDRIADILNDRRPRTDPKTPNV